MNYFAHGHPFVDQPYVLAGTALPDMLSAIHRRVRIRRQVAERFLDDCDPIVRDVAAGIVRHHQDDAWFHGQRAFVELSTRFAVELREQLSDGKGLRAGFLGHILVELMLDATLIARHTHGAAAYYAAASQVDPHILQAVVSRMAEKPVAKLVPFYQMFVHVRFLEDYASNEGLLMRVNQVLNRVALEPASRMILQWFPSARRRVAERIDELSKFDLQAAQSS